MKNRHVYPPDWFDTIRPHILKRDGYKCTICGVHHRATVYKNEHGGYTECDDFLRGWANRTGKKLFIIYLQVMHKDQNPQNCDSNNLESACPRCHLAYDRKFNSIKRRMRGRQQGRSL